MYPNELDDDVFTKDIDNPAGRRLRELFEEQDYTFAPGSTTRSTPASRRWPGSTPPPT